MKKLLTFIIVLLFPFLTLNAQYEITNKQHERILLQVSENVYDVIFKNDDGQIVQKGQYWVENEKLKPHGVWVLFSSDDNTITTRSEFNQGKQLWVESFIDGKKIRVDYRLNKDNGQEEISMLENRIKDIQKN